METEKNRTKWTDPINIWIPNFIMDGHVFARKKNTIKLRTLWKMVLTTCESCEYPLALFLVNCRCSEEMFVIHSRFCGNRLCYIRNDEFEIREIFANLRKMRHNLSPQKTANNWSERRAQSVIRRLERDNAIQKRSDAKETNTFHLRRF